MDARVQGRKGPFGGIYLSLAKHGTLKRGKALRVSMSAMLPLLPALALYQPSEPFLP